MNRDVTEYEVYVDEKIEKVSLVLKKEQDAIVLRFNKEQLNHLVEALKRCQQVLTKKASH